MEDSWTIVQFLNDQTVEAVPSNWIQGDHCHWPSYPPQKMQIAIRKSEPLNTCWTAYPVKVFRHGTYDDYMTARKKARVAEETSDLNTDYGADESQKRKRVKKVLSSSSEDSLDESLLDIPPNIKCKKTNNNLNQTEKGAKTAGNVTTIIADGGSKGGAPKPWNSNSQNDTASERDINSDIQQVCKNCIDNKDKQIKILIQQGHILRGLITETLNEVKAIKIAVQNKQGAVEKKTSLFENPAINFPISDDEDFEKFESFLQNEDNFSNATQELSKIGGSNTYDHVKRILQIIISNQQALKYSWHGMKGNRKFKETITAKLLLKSTEAAGLGENQKTTESAMQTWLRRASDRRITEGKRVQKKF